MFDGIANLGHSLFMVIDFSPEISAESDLRSTFVRLLDQPLHHQPARLERLVDLALDRVSHLEVAHGGQMLVSGNCVCLRSRSMVLTFCLRTQNLSSRPMSEMPIFRRYP